MKKYIKDFLKKLKFHKKKIIIAGSLSILLIAAVIAGLAVWKLSNMTETQSVTEIISNLEGTVGITVPSEFAETSGEEQLSDEEPEETEETEETVSDEEFDEFIEEEVPCDDEEALKLPERTMTNESIPYDGQYREISCWGDSMTQGWGAGPASITINGIRKDISYYTYPSTLQELTGIRTYNFGMPGKTSEEIAIMQGGIPIVTDRDVVVTESGMSEFKLVKQSTGRQVYMDDYSGYGAEEYNEYPDVVYIMDRAFLITEREGRQFLSRVYQLELNSGKISGSPIEIDGTEETTAENASTEETTVKNTSTEETTAENPSTEETTAAETESSEETLTIPAGTRVYTKASVDHKDDILILEIGSNGGWASNYQLLILQYDAMIQSSGCKYYIIVGDTDDPGTSIGDTTQGETDEDGNYIGIGDTAWEAALREAYGDHFINMRTYLIENGLSDVGLMPTKSDLINYKKGNISKRLRSDWTHLNSMGYYAKGVGIYKKGVELGYWS